MNMFYGTSVTPLARAAVAALAKQEAKIALLVAFKNTKHQNVYILTVSKTT